MTQRTKKQCSIDGCDSTGRLKRGWCPKHYSRWLNHGDPNYRPVHAKDLPCKVESCEKLVHAKGMCNQHYRRFLATGKTSLDRLTEVERFWSHVDKKTPLECWEWQGGKRSDYGFFNIPPTTIGAHRYSFELANGEIPDGKMVDHICHNPPCVNPYHLRLADYSQNGQNRKGATSISKSGVRGVWWDTTNKKWVAQVGHRGKIHSAGHHDTKESAEEAVISLRNKLHTHNWRDRIGTRTLDIHQGAS